MSDSSEQRAAEAIIIAGVAARLGVELRQFTLTVDGARAAVDGVSEDRSILVGPTLASAREGRTASQAGRWS